MNIQILQLVEGAKAARGMTVIIDVFRAFSFETYLFARGVERVIPVGDVERAYRLKRENPQYVLAGERGGKILDGFDIGNSPSQLLDIDFSGKTVVHTTSAGTQGIANATYADEILACGLVNARATAEYIRKSRVEEVSLVCMGLEALAPTEEDTLCAVYIKNLLEGRPTNLKEEIESLKHTSGAKFFDPSQWDVFPYEDFAMCTDVDHFNFVLKLEKNEGEIPYMTRKFVCRHT